MNEDLAHQDMSNVAEMHNTGYLNIRNNRRTQSASHISDRRLCADINRKLQKLLQRERERERGVVILLSFSKIICVVASVVDERTKGMLRWWNDTDRGKRKY
jgi:hypothetical protein